MIVVCCILCLEFKYGEYTWYFVRSDGMSIHILVQYQQGILKSSSAGQATIPKHPGYFGSFTRDDVIIPHYHLDDSVKLFHNRCFSRLVHITRDRSSLCIFYYSEHHQYTESLLSIRFWGGRTSRHHSGNGISPDDWSPQLLYQFWIIVLENISGHLIAMHFWTPDCISGLPIVVVQLSTIMVRTYNSNNVRSLVQGLFLQYPADV